MESATAGDDGRLPVEPPGSSRHTRPARASPTRSEHPQGSGTSDPVLVAAHVASVMAYTRSIQDAPTTRDPSSPRPTAPPPPAASNEAQSPAPRVPTDGAGVGIIDTRPSSSTASPTSSDSAADDPDSGPTDDDGSPPAAQRLCRLPGCLRRVWVEPDGRSHDFCSWRHADAGSTGQNQRTSNRVSSNSRPDPAAESGGPCRWAHCLRQCFRRADGSYHDYCTRAHAKRDGALTPSTESQGAARWLNPRGFTTVLPFYDGSLPSAAPTLIALSNHYVHSAPFSASWGVDGLNDGRTARVWQDYDRSCGVPNGPPPRVILKFRNVQLHSAEQGLMIGKACVFGDRVALRQLLSDRGRDPTFCKQVGRSVTGLVDAVWKQLRGNLALEVLRHKFQSSPVLTKLLLDTGDRTLAEAAENDEVWGIGLPLGDPRVAEPSLWPVDPRVGNLLGRTLEIVRADLLAGIKASASLESRHDFQDDSRSTAVLSHVRRGPSTTWAHVLQPLAGNRLSGQTRRPRQLRSPRSRLKSGITHRSRPLPSVRYNRPTRPAGANAISLGPRMGSGCQLKYADTDPDATRQVDTSLSRPIAAFTPSHAADPLYVEQPTTRVAAERATFSRCKQATTLTRQEAWRMAERLPNPLRARFRDWLRLTQLDLPNAWDQALKGHTFTTFRAAVSAATSHGSPELWRIFRSPKPYQAPGRAVFDGAPCGAGNFLTTQGLQQAMRDAQSSLAPTAQSFPHADGSSKKWSIGPGSPSWPPADPNSVRRTEVIQAVWPGRPLPGRAQPRSTDAHPNNLSGGRSPANNAVSFQPAQASPFILTRRNQVRAQLPWPKLSLEDVLATSRFNMRSSTFAAPLGRHQISSVSARAWASSHNPAKQPEISHALPAFSSARAYTAHSADTERRTLLPWPHPLFRWIADAFDACASEVVRKHLANTIQGILFCTPVREHWTNIDWSQAPLPWGLISWDVPLQAAVAVNRPAVTKQVSWGNLHTRILETSFDLRSVPLSPGHMPHQPSRLQLDNSARCRLDCEPHSGERATRPEPRHGHPDKHNQSFPEDQLAGPLLTECARRRMPVPTYGTSADPMPWLTASDFKEWNSEAATHGTNLPATRSFGPAFNAMGAARSDDEDPELHGSATTRWSTPLPQSQWAAQPPTLPEPLTWATSAWNTPAHWLQPAPGRPPPAALPGSSSSASTSCIVAITGSGHSPRSAVELLQTFESEKPVAGEPSDWPAFLRWFFGGGFLVTRMRSTSTWSSSALVAAVLVCDNALPSELANASCLLRTPLSFARPRAATAAPAWVAAHFTGLPAASKTVWGVYNVELLSADLLNATTGGLPSLQRVPRAPAPEIMNVPTETQQALLAFSATRRMIGATGSWFSRDVFYDDFLSNYYEAFATRVAESESHLARELGVDMADGVPYYKSNTPGKNKHEVAQQHEDMTSLGLEVQLRAAGKLTFGTAKRTRVSGRGLLILADAHRERRLEHDRWTALGRTPRQLRPRTSGSNLRSWIGQVSDLGNACPTVAITLSNLHAVLPPGFGDTEAMELSVAIQELILDVVLAVRNSTGRAAMPTAAIPDPADGNTWVTLCDSARKLVKHSDGEHWSVGAGGWVMNLATRVVVRFCFGWRTNELKRLCISTLEAKTQEVALFIVSLLAPAQPGVVVWCLQYGDNMAESEHILNTFRGIAAVSRVIASRRSALIMARPDLAVKSQHIRRHQNSESDALADHDVDRADDLIRLRLAAAGSGVHIVELTTQDIPTVVRDTTDLTDAVQRVDHNVWSRGMRTRATNFFEERANEPTSAPAYMAGFVNYIAALVSARDKLTISFQHARSSWPLLHRDLPAGAALSDSDRRRCGFAAEAMWDLSMPGARWRAPAYRPMPPVDRNAAAEPFLTTRDMPRIRRNNPLLRIPADASEALQAPDAGRHTLPRTGPADTSFPAFVDYLGMYLRQLDDKLAAQRDVAIRACQGPPRPRPPFHFRQLLPASELTVAGAVAYVNDLREYFLQRYRDYSADAIQACESAPCPMTTRRLFPFPYDLDIIDEWLLAYDAEWQRCTSVDDVFDISSLPSNGVIDHGVVVRASHLNCHGLSWDTGAAYEAGSNALRRDFPILPVVWADPQLFTELKLGDILAKIAYNTFLGNPCDDVDIAIEHVFLGFDVRTTVESCVILSANTKAFFENREFVNSKTAEKMSKFATPRLSPGVRGLAIVPCFLLSNNVILDQIAEDTQAVKPRLTCNPSGPFPRNRRHRGQPETTWADLGYDLTINGNHVRPVPFDYLKLTDVAHNGAIFLAGQRALLAPDQNPSLLAVGQQKSDMASFYECLARGTCWWRFNANYVTSRGMQLNSRCCFGFSAEPDTANRWSLILCNMMNDDLQMEQAAWERLFVFAQDGAP